MANVDTIREFARVSIVPSHSAYFSNGEPCRYVRCYLKGVVSIPAKSDPTRCPTEYSPGPVSQVMHQPIDQTAADPSPGIADVPINGGEASEIGPRFDLSTFLLLVI